MTLKCILGHKWRYIDNYWRECIRCSYLQYNDVISPSGKRRWYPTPTYIP